MLSRGKCAKLEQAIRAYREVHLHSTSTTFDERIERHRAVALLSDVLGFAPVSDIRSEAQLKGPADFAIQLQGDRQMLVSIRRPGAVAQEELLARVLRFAVIEGVDWLLTIDGAHVGLHRVKYEEPSAAREVFMIDLADPLQVGAAAQVLQFLQKDVVARKGLDLLWNRTIALDPKNLAALLCSSPVVNYLQRTLRARSMSNFTEAEVIGSVKRVLMDGIGPEEETEVERNGQQPKTTSRLRKGRGLTPAASAQTPRGTSY